VAILGDMLELGPAEVEGHLQVADAAAEVADALLAVGERARVYANRFAERRPDAPVQWAPDAPAAAELLPEVGPGDVVLVKGSRGIALETVVEALLH
jgi:UDP-N-acetylmuramoyl-tripeptide--D-alanyl-D-alanine ligase